MIVYGSDVCPRTIEAIKRLKEKNIKFEYKNFCEDIKALKEFITIRDENVFFNEIKNEKRIGIPCFVLNDDIITMDIDSVIKYYIDNK